MSKENEDNKKYSEPTIEETIEGYKVFIQSLGGSFLEFLEAYNDCLNIAEGYEVIGDVELKARIKDFSSAKNNTDNKELDDMFGMEIVAPTEQQKEFFILFNKLISETLKSKKYNKSTGYRAYHSVEDLKISDIDNLEEEIKNIIENAETEEWKTSDITKSKEIVKVFRKMKSNAIESNVIEALSKMRERIKNTGLNRVDLPMIEYHFLTADVQEEATRGKCSHDKYKKDVTQEQIMTLFNNGNLYRGINSPWKFERKNGKIVLQDFYKTLIENWPFLRRYIVERRIENKAEEDINKNRIFDIHLASQFEFLKKYINQDIGYIDEIKKAEMWGKLKSFIIFYRLKVDGQDNKSVEEELLNLPNEGGR